MQPRVHFRGCAKGLCAAIGHVINSVNKKRNRNKRRIARGEKKGKIRWESTEERNWPPLATTTSLLSLLSSTSSPPTSFPFFLFPSLDLLLVFSLAVVVPLLPPLPSSTMCSMHYACEPTFVISRIRSNVTLA